MSHFGAIGHHLIVAIIDHIPNGWVMHSGKSHPSPPQRRKKVQRPGPSTAITCPSPTRSLILALVEAKRAGRRSWDLGWVRPVRPESLRG